MRLQGACEPVSLSCLLEASKFATLGALSRLLDAMCPCAVAHALCPPAAGFRRYDRIRETLIHELVGFYPACSLQGKGAGGWHCCKALDRPAGAEGPCAACRLPLAAAAQAHMVHGDHDNAFKELNSQVQPNAGRCFVQRGWLVGWGGSVLMPLPAGSRCCTQPGGSARRPVLVRLLPFCH